MSEQVLPNGTVIDALGNFKGINQPAASRLHAEQARYYSDRAYRESLPCGECGAVGGCQHFPKEVAPTREP